MTIVKSLRTGEQEAEFRQLWSYLLEQSSTGKAKTGVLAGCAVAATTPSATGSVVIGVGLANVQPTTGGGAFPELVTAAETVDVFTANPMQFETNPRNDIIGITQDGAATVLVGTPNAIPTDPTVPSTVVPLWRLRHAAGATTITPQAADDLRASISLNVTEPGWVTYTPAWTADVTNPNPGNGSVTGRYKAGRDGMVDAIVVVKMGTSGQSQGSGSYSLSLPVAADLTEPFAMSGTGVYNTNGKSYLMSPSPLDSTHVRMVPNGSSVVWKSDTPDLITTSAVLRVQMRYRKA